MSSRTRVRFLGAASALMLAATAACASGPVRPTLVHKKDARIQSLALIEAAARLAALERTNATPATITEGFEDAWPATPPSEALKADAASRQVLIEAALRRMPSNVRAWDAVKQLAQSGALSYDDKARWAQVLFTLCGKNYADFSLDVLEPMIKTQQPPEQQAKLWEATFKTYSHRPDLASQVRLALGEMWELAGDKSKAWDAYQDVIRKFVNEGPYAVSAAGHIEKLLRDNDKADQVPAMYESAYRKAVKPKRGSPEFLRGSNWFQLGYLHAAALMQVGKTREAAAVCAELGIDPSMIRRR